MATPAKARSPLIAHVVYSFSVGGLENGVVNLINRMPGAEWRHAVLSLTDFSPEFVKRVTRPGVEYIAFGKAPGHLLRLYPKLTALIRRLRPDIVHTRNLAALEATIPAWLAGVPARVHGEHGRDVTDPDGSRRRYQLVRRAYRPFVTRYVAVSRDLETYLSGRVGVPAARISQIYNGVDADRFRPEAGDRTPIDGCPFDRSGHWLVGSVGRIQAVKDHVGLVRAVARMFRLHPPAAARVRLAIIGDGPERARVEAAVAEHGLDGRVWISGERADVPAILRRLDCFVLPSVAEGISNTILEAMATGLPIVATRVGGNPELLEDGLTGSLVPPSDPESLAKAMLGYFLDSAAARRHGRAARQTVLRRFSLDRMVADYAQLYRDVLGLGRERGSPVGASR
jgi:sugar transferase (PEP-CTERM/EpsH1 system associated)